MSDPSGATTSLLEPRFLRLLGRLAVQIQGRVRGDRRGERRSSRRGVGGEFVDVRPYTPGDDLRHLDWHLYARLDALLVRLYEAQEEHTVHILLDTSASMGCGKGLYSKQLAAALGYLALASSDTVGLYAMTGQIDARVGPLRGKGAAHRVFDFLDRVSFEGPTGLERSVREFAGSRRRGTAVLISDFLIPDRRVEVLSTLARAQMRVAVLHVLSGEERDPQEGEELTLIDAETGEEMVVSVDRRVRRAYLGQLAAMTGELREACRSYGFAFIEVDSRTPLEALVLGELRQGGLVG